MSHLIELLNVSPARNTRPIVRFGLLPALARGRIKAVWLVSRSRLEWAIAHVRKRHAVSEVGVFRVRLSRGALVRRRRGVWSAAEPILPWSIVSVRPAAFCGAA
ncbi:MAG TPA: hypothetical protein VFW33_23780 [Gemmataceae bacterium]|nr:hypothetical protein [Gemmataceae bacterium]